MPIDIKSKNNNFYAIRDVKDHHVIAIFTPEIFQLTIHKLEDEDDDKFRQAIRTALESANDNFTLIYGDQ